MSGVIHDNPKQVVTLLCTKNNLCHGLTISVLDATKLYHLDQPYGFIRNKLQYLESLLHKKWLKVKVIQQASLSLIILLKSLLSKNNNKI